MRSVPCPNNAKDNGICTIPDETVVVTADEIAVRSREQVEAAFPDLELDVVDLTPVDVLAGPEELALALTEEAESATQRVGRALMARIAASPASEGVLVHCTCGETFIAPLQ
jgi:hypothetical protein